MRRLLLALALCTSLQAAYTSRASVTIPAATGSTQTNITLAISGTDVKLKTVANGGQVQNTVVRLGQTVPADLVLTSDAGCTTLYTWGWDFYNATTGAVKMWLLMPSHSSAGSTTVFVCVGNAAVVTYQGGAVGAEFDASTAAAYHLPDGTTLSGKDFTANANDTTVTGTVTAAAGQVDGAAAFGATGANYLAGANSVSLNLTGSVTMSAWVFPTISNAYQGIILKAVGNNADREYSFFLSINGTSNIYTAVNKSAAAPYLALGQDIALSTPWVVSAWNFITVSVNAGVDVRVYINGALSGTVSGNYGTVGLGEPLWLGGDQTAFPLVSGSIDEARISSTNRSANWIATEYGNQLSPPAIGAFSAITTATSQGFVF